MNAPTPALAGSGTLALQREVARALASPRRVSELLASVTMVVARATSSVRAEAWIIAPSGDRAVLLAHWGEDAGAWASLHQRHERAQIARGEGVIGAAWSHGRAAHGPDEHGVARGTLAFVVPLAGAPCMIVALYGEPLEAPDPLVLEALGAIGVQLGAMLARFELERAVRESERRQRQIVDAMPSALLAIGSDGRIVDCNRSAERLLGRNPEDLLGQPAIDVLAPARWRSRFERALRAIGAMGRMTARTRVPIRAGVGERITALQIGSIDGGGLALVLDDVTERVAEERALRRALREARREVRERDDFGALLAHELRNPLAAIVMAGELIASGDADAMEQARVVIQRQAEHTVRLVDDLLDVSRARRGKLTVGRARVSVQRVLDLAIELATPALRERGHRLTVNASVRGVWLAGDEARLAQVLSNLLNNAARYTPRGGNVELEAKASVDEVVLRVRDDGIGMSPALCETAFQPFRRGARTGAGLGLGLAIVKSLVELHGGRVSARSDGPGTGSTLEVRLPRWRRRYTS